MSLKDKYTDAEWTELENRVLSKMFPSGSISEKSQFTIEKFPEINRVEVIGPGGRQYTNYNAKDVEISFQDNGKTLKIFLNNGI